MNDINTYFSGQMHVFDFERRRYRRLINSTPNASCLTFAPNANDIAILIGTKDGFVQTIDLGKCQWTIISPHLAQPLHFGYIKLDHLLILIGIRQLQVIRYARSVFLPSILLQSSAYQSKHIILYAIQLLP